MKAVGAPRSYVERATGLLLDTRRWSTWVSVTGKMRGLLLRLCRHIDRGLSMRFAASDLHAHDVGTMLSSDPSCNTDQGV